MAKYILAKRIFFDNEKNILFDVNNEKDSVNLPAAVSRCLTIFIQKKGVAISKRDMMYIGWGKYGTVVTEGSIWQAMSQLRKSLNHFGLCEQAIITIPRVGYQLSSAISVERYVPHPEADSLIELSHASSIAAVSTNQNRAPGRKIFNEIKLKALAYRKETAALISTQLFLIILFPIALVLLYKIPAENDSLPLENGKARNQFSDYSAGNKDNNALDKSVHDESPKVGAELDPRL